MTSDGGLSYATAHVFVSVYVAVSNESLRANLEEERLLFPNFTSKALAFQRLSPFKGCSGNADGNGNAEVSNIV